MMEQEQQYYQALSSAQSYSIEEDQYNIYGKRLEITYDGGVLVFQATS
ncbi:MAG: hypothetical protein HC893_10400 [Chloroflexaceae bacterium]|nr:hypothetical protein [Chloroflexaceae bacterium]